jgi:predicted nucleotidyltransferase
LTIRQALTVNVPEIREEILARIRKAEDEHDVRVLLAVESGSRAWGFASPDSDYDARFLYVNRPDWYLSVGLEEQRDVIEYDIVDDIDLNGWDLRKALRLFWRSSPAFVEWIQSPIVYVEEGRLAAQVRALLPRVYSCTSGVHHYRSMARTNYRGYLRADQVPLKKYFYVLRPLLAVLWLEKYQTPAPIEFDRLLHLIEADAALLRDIQRLLARKRATPELGLAAPIPGINAFIERELARLETSEVARPTRGEVLPMLNEVFRQSLDEAWRGHRS